MIAVYGHRGAMGEAPENTLAGFTYAAGLRIARVEMDVRLSADEQLVVIHDKTVDRTTGGTGRIEDLSLGQLRRLDARGTYTTWPDRVGVPTFIECLELLADFRGLTLQVEVKKDAPERLERVCSAICRALRDHSVDERAVVSSFEPAALEIVQSLAPHLHRAFITATDPSGSITTATRLSCSQIDIGRTVLSPKIAREAHGRGLAVTGWFGNTVDELRYLADCDVDAVITDFPSLALRVQ